MVRIRVSAGPLLVGLAMAVQGCSPLPVSAWTQALGDAGHSSSNPGETVLTARTVATLHRTWSAQRLVDSAVVDGDQVFTTEQVDVDHAVLVDRALDTGRVRWTYPLAVGVAHQVVADGAGSTVYVGSFQYGSPTSAYGTVLAAVNQVTGLPRWVQPRRPGGLGLTFGGGRLYLDRPEGMTTALDPTGRALWTSPMTGGGGSYASGRYFTAGVVLDAATGARLWRYDEQPAFLSTGDVVSGTRMIVGGANGLDNNANSGAFAWYSTTGCGHPLCSWTGVVQTPSRQYSPMAAQADTVLAWTFSGVQAYSLVTGRLLWQETSDSDMLQSWIAGDLVWTLDQTSTLRAYRLGGCGATVCPPVSALPPAPGTLSQSGLTARGTVLTWGIGGVSAAAAR